MSQPDCMYIYVNVVDSKSTHFMNIGIKPMLAQQPKNGDHGTIAWAQIHVARKRSFFFVSSFWVHDRWCGPIPKAHNMHVDKLHLYKLCYNFQQHDN